MEIDSPKVGDVKLFMHYYEPELIFEDMLASTKHVQMLAQNKEAKKKMKGVLSLADRVGVGLKRRINNTTK